MQLGWKGWILCSWWTISSPSHREDRQYFPPWKGCTALSSNSKSRVYPEQHSRSECVSKDLSIELRVRGLTNYTSGVILVNFKAQNIPLFGLRREFLRLKISVFWFLVQPGCNRVQLGCSQVSRQSHKSRNFIHDFGSFFLRSRDYSSVDNPSVRSVIVGKTSA